MRPANFDETEEVAGAESGAEACAADVRETFLAGEDAGVLLLLSHAASKPFAAAPLALPFALLDFDVSLDLGVLEVLDSVSRLLI